MNTNFVKSLKWLGDKVLTALITIALVSGTALAVNPFLGDLTIQGGRLSFLTGGLFQLPVVGSDPGTCSEGDLVWRSDTDAIRGCGATDTWGAIGGSNYVQLFEVSGASGLGVGGTFSTNDLGPGRFGPNLTVSAGSNVSNTGFVIQSSTSNEDLYIKGFIPPASSGVNLADVNIRIMFKSVTTSTAVAWSFQVSPLTANLATNVAITGLTYTDLGTVSGTTSGTSQGIAYAELNDLDLSATSVAPGLGVYWWVGYDFNASAGVEMLAITCWTE